jgi:hypothetical protein
MLTADELLAIARQERPGVTYTRNRHGTAIAAWKNGRWQTVAGKVLESLCGMKIGWVSVGDLLINGEPVNKPEDWLPVDGAHEPEVLQAA